MNFSSDISGLRLRAIAPQTAYTISPATDLATTATTTIPTHTTITLTGAYLTIGGVEYYQIADRPYLYITAATPGAWTDRGREATPTRAQAQRQVDTIIDANKQILENNLFCARYAYRLTPAQKQRLADLQTRLQRRDQSLALYTTSNVTSQPRGYAALAPYLQSLMASAPYVGIAAWIIITVAAIVIASLSSAAYFAYRSYATEAIQDVRYSKQLTRTLQAKLTPEEWQQLRTETAGLISKSTILQKINSLGATTRNILLLTAGALIILNTDKIKSSLTAKS